MIKIEKPKNIPLKLRKKGAEESEKLKAVYLAAEVGYQSGVKKFQFERNIYGHKTIKELLRNIQHNKCCFCERKIEVGDVEHYRPKGGWQQKDGDKIAYPGYYWLVYDWENLLLACAKCNTSFKRNFFPLTDPSRRARSHLDKLELENPLIIHPAKEDPAQYIEYIGHLPRAIEQHPKGIETIKRVGLDRPLLDEDRNMHYQIFKTIYRAATDQRLPQKVRDELLKQVEDAAKPNRAFAGVIRSGLKYQFRY